MAETYVIGVNGGGTRTNLVVTDGNLNPLGRVDVGPSNYQNVGEKEVHETLRQGIAEVIRLAGLKAEQIAGLGAGLGGVDRPVDHEVMQRIFESILPGVPITVDNDAVAALVAVAGRRYGVVVIAGTGSIAFGFDERGGRIRSGGWGHFTDKGSGYAIGHDTIEAVVAAHDGTAPATALTARVLKVLNLAAPTDLVGWIYAPDRRVDQIAALAAETVALEEKDTVATTIIARAADGLAREAINVARQLTLGDKPFPLVGSGSLFKYSALLRDEFVSRVQTVFSGAVLMQAERDAAIGAAMMALENLGAAVSLPPITIPETSTRRATERRNRLTMKIQERPSIDFMRLMNFEDQRVPQVVSGQVPQIAALVDGIAERFAEGGRIFFVGAGTSGRLAVLDAAECHPTFGTSLEEVSGILAGGLEAMIESREGAEDDEAQGHNEIAVRNVGPKDSVVGVAASGSTPFVQGALREASERGALTGSIANVVNAPISALAQHPIELPTGSEVIMGSTRLKAGTAQKLALNMISTGVMVCVGRTYENLMVDMLSSNIKLRKRAVIIVAEATGLDQAQAGDLLEGCNGEIKTAIASAILGIAPQEARQCLSEVKGNLRQCLQARRH